MDTPKKISFSQYRVWRECHYQWELYYVDRLGTFEQNIHSIFGTAMHTTIQDWMETFLYSDKSDLVASTIDLSETLRDELIKESKEHLKQLDEGGNEYFIFSRQELDEFYQQGVEILRYIQENHKDLFPSKSRKLYSIEHELSTQVLPNVVFVGYIDIVVYDEKEDKYYIYDLKTSTRGWNKYVKRDKKKTDQVLLYKHFFSEETGIPVDNIEGSFTILKRVLVDSPYPNPRAINFTPPQGKPSMNKALKGLHNFISECFDDGGEYIKGQKAMPSENACRFCPFSEDGTCEYSVKLRSNKKKEKENEEEWVSLK